MRSQLGLTLMAQKPQTNIFLQVGEPVNSPLANLRARLQMTLSNYALEKEIIRVPMTAPIDRNMDLKVFAGWLHTYLIKDGHLQELKDLATITPINFLRDAAMGKISWLQTSAEQAAAWFLLFDYGKYVEDNSLGYTPDDAGRAGLYNDAEWAYQQLKALYDLRDKDPKTFSTYVDLMQQFLFDPKFATRAGAMYFMLKLATTDPVYALPAPEAIFIQEGLVGRLKEPPKALTDLATAAAEEGIVAPVVVEMPAGPSIFPAAQTPKKKPIGLYVGAGVGVLALVGVIVWATRKN